MLYNIKKDRFGITNISEYLKTDILIIGTGISGLVAAARLATSPFNITLICNKKITDNSTYKAQGGIACAILPTDNYKSHINDTIRAGNGFNYQKNLEILMKNSKKAIEWLVNSGMEFDKNENFYDLGMEGAHSKKRILHAGGDITGKCIFQFLTKKISQYENIRIIKNCAVFDFYNLEGNIKYTLCNYNNKILGITSSNIIIASGGYGGLYPHTTQPKNNTGNLLIISLLNGTRLLDLEFVQFHPTVFHKNNKTFLISEAVRGEGAYLIDKDNNRFMVKLHKMAELAPRDIVAREIFKRNGAYLNLRHLNREYIIKRFPNIYNFFKNINIDFTSELIPVYPAAHYTIGGIGVFENGNTGINGVYAVGECSANGVHGANRLASNSLLEGLVFGKIAAENILKKSKPIVKNNLKKLKVKPYDFDDKEFIKKINNIATHFENTAGIIRHKDSLLKFINTYQNILNDWINNGISFKNRSKFYKSLLSLLITKAAYERQESRGVHFREDYPYESNYYINKRIVFFYSNNKGITMEFTKNIP